MGHCGISFLFELHLGNEECLVLLNDLDYEAFKLLLVDFLDFDKDYLSL